MGKLLTLQTLELHEGWYFDDAWYNSTGQRTEYKWPSPNFPHMVTLHIGTFDKVTGLKSKIRQWIENTITDTVIYDVRDLSYRHYYSDKYDWDHSYEVDNRWGRFHFENEHTAAMFRLTFSEVLQDITNHHPKYPEHAEWCNLTNEEKYEKTRYR